MEYLHMSLAEYIARDVTDVQMDRLQSRLQSNIRKFSKKTGVILLDVKPENIMLSRSYYPYLIDFGGGWTVKATSSKAAEISLLIFSLHALLMQTEFLFFSSNLFGMDYRQRMMRHDTVKSAMSQNFPNLNLENLQLLQKRTNFVDSNSRRIMISFKDHVFVMNADDLRTFAFASASRTISAMNDPTLSFLPAESRIEVGYDVHGKRERRYTNIDIYARNKFLEKCDNDCDWDSLPSSKKRAYIETVLHDLAKDDFMRECTKHGQGEAWKEALYEKLCLADWNEMTDEEKKKLQMRHRLQQNAGRLRNTVLDTFDSGAQKIGETVYGKFDPEKTGLKYYSPPEKGWKGDVQPHKRNKTPRHRRRLHKSNEEESTWCTIA